MRPTHIARLAFVLAVAALGLTANPSAYALFGWKWGTLQVPYYINPANSDVSAGATVTAIQAGADAWRLQTSTPFSLYYGGYTDGSTVTYNSKNEVFFRNAANGSAIATTYTWSSGDRALEADVVFWDGAYTFFTGSSGCSNGYYIEDVVTHEFGHALGLNHSSVASATMAPAVAACSMSFRALDADDVQAIEALYPPSSSSPPPSNTPPSARILSPASGTTFDSGSTETLSGLAQDAQDGDISSKIVWSSNLQGTLGGGATIAVNLVAGSHTITAKVSDSAGAPAQASVTVTISTPTAPASTVVLKGSGRKQKGLQKAELGWTGATTWSGVDVFRNGAKRATTSNSGSYTDDIGLKGGGSYTYYVCSAGTTSCSNTVTVTF